jgi:hypothetical protein
MFSRGATGKPFAVEDEAFPATADERRTLSVTVAVMLAVAGIGLLLPAPSMSTSSSIAAVTIPVAQAQAEPVANAAPRMMANVEVPAALPTAVPSPANAACSQHSWPYVCAGGAGDVRRVRVISTDRNAPASVVVSVREERPAVRPAAEDASPAGVSQLSAASNPANAEFVRPVNNAALPVSAAADVPIKVSVTFMPATAAAQAKPAVRHRTSARKLAQKSPARSRLPAGREALSAALAYGEAPRHRVDSYPWADAGFR